jgi:methylenetetrahydrofolate reductase (NADPH)
MSRPSTLTDPATKAPSERPDPLTAIAALMRDYSLEATRPSEDEIAALAAIAPVGTHVYLSAVPGRPPLEAIAAAARLRRRDFEPVPHLAVRNFESEQALDDFLARAAGEAGVRRVLVIAGDRDHPLGPLRGALEVIDGGALGRHGITGIGVAGYPDGHPRIAEGDLDRALADKIAAAQATGLDLHVVTQFCFDAATILAWIARLREFGSEHPVRVGLAGPTSLATLLRYAQRCGVRASAQGMARQSGLVRQLFALSAPDALIRALAEARADGQLGEIAPHFFSFGGLVRSARWAQAVAERRIALDTGEGFRVEPP